MDLRDHLDHLAAFEPAHRPVEDRLLAGRRALRRRRAASLAVTTAVLAALGTGYVAVTAGGDQRATEPPAGTPTSTPTPAAVPDTWARWQDGGVVVADGVTEMQRVDADSGEVGLQLRVGGEVRWYLVSRDGSSSTDASVAFDSLEDWVADQTTPDSAALVRLAADGTLTPGRDGVTILEQVASPDLPDSYDTLDGAGGDQLVTAAALVEVDGEQQWLLARDPAATDVVTVPLARAATMPQFLDFARQRYAEGPGGGSEGLL